ncbi:hypothetical protein [Amaricoccus sp.]|uniref:hypothetical protein n=1 Tax=Amaricoccus sp. TaxID=1872485 RepID=UPI001B52E401|nr:hypothetical protein [Amaricoccus sp.]MBP7243076.1 hypothetical protein [Amaricoccus sp.]
MDRHRYGHAGLDLCAGHRLDRSGRAARGLGADVGATAAAALAFLLLSYAAWGAALRPSLAANWDLLQRTGASTCLPSKTAHDIALRRGAGLGARRLAAAAGYVGAELAKEAPYYFGAAGAALLVDGVTSIDALVFLGGANLGAAAYELGLAHATRGLLRRAPGSTVYASFEAEWDPQRYLADYYAGVEADERHAIAFLAGAAQGLPPGQSVLVFGSGRRCTMRFRSLTGPGSSTFATSCPGTCGNRALDEPGGRRA